MGSGKTRFNLRRILTLKEDMTIEWMDDTKWDELTKLRDTLFGKQGLRPVRSSL